MSTHPAPAPAAPAAADPPPLPRLHPLHQARLRPDKPAYIMAATGEAVTFAALDRAANRGAHLLRRLGLKRGDGVALFADNSARFFEVVWAAERAGVYLTPISCKLTAEEAAYIVADAGAGAIVASRGVGGAAEALAALRPDLPAFMLDGTAPGFRSWEEAVAAEPETLPEDAAPGSIMLYSSGTTGRPKGIRQELPAEPLGETAFPLVGVGQLLYGWHPDMVYLSPAPLYHAAPLRFSMAVQALGGTVIVMEHFDAEAALAAIETHRVTHAQWVPTHFVRMLKLPEEARARHDLSSLQHVWHAAAPCPVPVKRAMIEWWGPIISEYYAGSEGNGFVAISAAEWLAHPGSVGRGLTAKVRICTEEGEELGPRQEGMVYFEGTGSFRYHNDPEKTRSSYNQHGWSTLGDVGWVDEEGYLYLTDRKSFMIISGGVNIYPQEIENLLVTHPKVADVAVFSGPHEEMGEEVIAVIQPMDMAEAGPDLAAELNDFARAHLSHVKVPRRIDFMAELPRHATGKLYKRLLRDRYWAKESA